jgi:hypothetical protein
MNNFLKIITDFDLKLNQTSHFSTQFENLKHIEA